MDNQQNVEAPPLGVFFEEARRESPRATQPAAAQTQANQTEEAPEASIVGQSQFH